MPVIDTDGNPRLTAGGRLPIHIFSSGETKLAFDGNSMYLFKLTDDQVEDLQQRLSENIQTEELDPDGTSVSSLLCAMSVQAALQQAAVIQPNVSRLWLHLAHSCNLRCRYCFADAGTYSQQNRLMTPSVARDAVDFLLRHCQGPAAKIVFFGGEPLLNTEVLKETVLYAQRRAQEKGMQMLFNLITNLTLLTEDIAVFCKEHSIDIQVSLDGPRDINDAQRVYHDGTGSYDVISENLELMRRLDMPLRGVRATITDLNADIGALYEFLGSLGFANIGMVPVQSDLKTGMLLTEDGVTTIRKGYQLAADRIIENIRTVGKCSLGPLGLFVRRLSELRGKAAFCDRGVYMTSVTPEGALYPCHRVVSDPSMQIGDIYSGFRKPFEEIDCMGSSGLDDKPECLSCWAKRLCGGGCAASSIMANGAGNVPDKTQCILLKAKLEAALRVYSAMKQERGT